MPSQDKYKDLLKDYSYRWNEGQNKFSGKYSEIHQNRMVMKNLLPSSWLEDVVHTVESGNDPSGSRLATRSQVIHPIASAVAEKLRTDLKARDATFEVAGNDEKGTETAKAMERIMMDTYSAVNTRKKYVQALDHLVMSGTMITQAVCPRTSETIVMPDGKTVPANIGRCLTFVAYDPLTSMVDWNADPMNVQDTARWAIVTIGRFCKDAIKERWGVDVETETEYNADGTVAGTGLLVDQMKLELQLEAGLELTEGLYVREYYLNNGKRYVILQDGYVLEESWVAGAVKGQLPLCVTPFIADPDSVYGMTLSRFIETPLQITSTVLNQVADLNALRTNMPFITWEGMIDGGAYSLSMDSFTPGTVLELSVPQSARFNNAGVHMDMDVSKAIARPPIEEITQGANWLFEKALESVWYLTGLNPTALGGFQDKQIRVSNVTEMINQSSLRNSSALVMNLEAYFFNPITKAFIRFMSIYYDDFPELKKLNIEPEYLADMRSLRIVNGSYLPADKLQEQQRAEYMYQLAMQNPTVLSPDIAVEELLESLGKVPQRYAREPLEAMLEDEAVNLQQYIQQVGLEEFAMQVQQNALEQQQQQGGAVEGE